MPKGRIPSPDGLPMELFCIFFDLVIHFLVDIYNKACREGSLPDGFLLGDIILLPKKGNQLLIEKVIYYPT